MDFPIGEHRQSERHAHRQHADRQAEEHGAQDRGEVERVGEQIGEVVEPDEHRALAERGCEAALHEVPGRNHHTVIFRAIRADDPVGGAMLDFVRRHSAGR